MGKKGFLIFLAASLLTAFAALPARATAERDVGVTVGGKALGAVGMCGSSDGRVLVPLRAVSNALGAEEVLWDAADNSATVKAEGLTLYVPFGKPWIRANGRYYYNPGGAPVTAEGVSYLPVEALAWAFGADYTYAPGKGGVRITSAGAFPEPGERFYDSEDVNWMSRIIYAEAGAESFLSMVAVGNVVMNRVESGLYPDTVKEVVFDRKFGVQFTPAYSGAIYMEPSEESVIAAKLALEGTTVVGDSLFFAADYIAKTCWAGLNRPVTFVIGSIVFYG